MNKVLFLLAAALSLTGLLAKEAHYPFSKGTARMPTWLARTLSVGLAVFFIWLAFLK